MKNDDDFKEEITELLKKVEEEHSPEEMEGVAETIALLLSFDKEPQEFPFEVRNYIYDSLSLLLQSDIVETAKRIGVTFDYVFNDLLNMLNNHSEFGNEEATYVDSTLYRLNQISTDIKYLKKSYEARTDVISEYEDCNMNYSRVREE